jgi:hypothetical protein
MTTELGASAAALTTFPHDVPVAAPFSLTGSSPVAAAAAAIRSECHKAGIDSQLLLSMLRSAGHTGLDAALDFVFDRQPAVSPTDVAKLKKAVESLFDKELRIRGSIRSRTRRVVVAVRETAAGLIFLTCVWLVLGGIVTGQNSMARSSSPLTTLLVLAGSLVCLAALEAAHIGAVALSTANVTELKETHPRLHRLHPHIATKPLLERYLAGRQAGVVLVVFAVAEVTRTAGMAMLPGTSLVLPGWTNLFLAVGVPGAVMVLVVGQVTPQVITARRPAAVMNTAPMAWAFRATLGIAALGLANPAYWLAGRHDDEDERIPSAPGARHTATTVDVVGHGVEIAKRDITITADSSVSETAISTVFHRTGLLSHTVNVGSTPYRPISSAPHATLYRGDEVVPVIVVTSETDDATDGSYRLWETFSPRIGTFKSRDVLCTVFRATVPVRLDRDVMIVTAATRLVVLRVVLAHPPTPLPPAALRISNETNVDEPEVRAIEPTMNELDGSVEFVAIVHYPAMGSSISLTWGRHALMPASSPSMTSASFHYAEARGRE